MASRGDKINPLGMVARKHNEHRPFEIEQAGMDRMHGDSMDDSILRTHNEAIRLSDTRTEDKYVYTMKMT